MGCGSGWIIRRPSRAMAARRGDGGGMGEGKGEGEGGGGEGEGDPRGALPIRHVDVSYKSGRKTVFVRVVMHPTRTWRMKGGQGSLHSRQLWMSLQAWCVPGGQEK